MYLYCHVSNNFSGSKQLQQKPTGEESKTVQNNIPNNVQIDEQLADLLKNDDNNNY